MFAILYFLLPIPISMEFRPGVQGIGVFGISLISHRQLCREDSVSLVFRAKSVFTTAAKLEPPGHRWGEPNELYEFYGKVVRFWKVRGRTYIPPSQTIEFPLSSMQRTPGRPSWPFSRRPNHRQSSAESQILRHIIHVSLKRAARN